MADRLLIISPDEDLLNLLKPALDGSSMPGSPAVITRYPSTEEVTQYLTTGSDNVVGAIVGFSDPVQAVSLLETLSAADPGMILAGVDREAESSDVLAALRAGAGEFLAPPFDLGHLEQRFQQADGEKSSASRGHLICFLPAQGGNGASTIALHVARAMALHLSRDREEPAGPGESPVLLADFDFHSGTLAFRLRIDPEHSLLEAFLRPEAVDDLWSQLVTSWRGLDLLPAVTTGAVVPGAAMEYVPAIFESARRQYPYVVVDLPTALFSSSRDVLSLSHAVYVVCTPELMSLHLARRRIGDLLEMGIPKAHIHLLLNRDGTRGAIESKEINRVVGTPVAARFPNDYTGVAEAYLRGGLVDAKSELGGCCNALAKEIAGVEDEGDTSRTRSWKSFFSLG